MKREHVLIGFAQETLQTKKHSLDVVCSGPLVLQDIQANTAREVKVGVVDGCLEQDCRRRIRIVVGERECELEGQASVGCAVRALDGSRPRQQVAIG